MSGEVVRPRFGQPCFDCRNPVPEPRTRRLREEAEAERRRFLKSDIVCADCETARLVDAGKPRRR